jgi:hypothetical protein
VRGFGARGLGRPEINLQLLRQPGYDLPDERAFVHAKGGGAYPTVPRLASFPDMCLQPNPCSESVLTTDGLGWTRMGKGLLPVNKSINQWGLSDPPKKPVILSSFVSILHEQPAPYRAKPE